MCTCLSITYMCVHVCDHTCNVHLHIPPQQLVLCACVHVLYMYTCIGTMMCEGSKTLPHCAIPLHHRQPGSQGTSMYPRVHGFHGNSIVLRLSLSKLLLAVDVTGRGVQATMATLVFLS